MLFGKKNMQEIKIGINGMHCAMCSSRMQKAFMAAKGVISAEVDLENKCATVSYDENKITAEGLKTIVTETGYEPV